MKKISLAKLNLLDISRSSWMAMDLLTKWNELNAINLLLLETVGIGVGRNLPYSFNIKIFLLKSFIPSYLRFMDDYPWVISNSIFKLVAFDQEEPVFTKYISPDFIKNWHGINLYLLVTKYTELFWRVGYKNLFSIFISHNKFIKEDLRHILKSSEIWGHKTGHMSSRFPKIGTFRLEKKHFCTLFLMHTPAL